MSIPVEFILFAATLVGVALLHSRSLEVAACGLGAVLVYKLAFTGFHGVSGLGGLLHHLAAEWVILANLLCLLLGFALLSRHFEQSRVPDRIPELLPDDWRGGFVLLVLVFVLSSFLDNIAAALIGGTVAASVYRHKVHIGYIAALVAASNAGGSGSVVGDTTTTMMWIDGVSPRPGLPCLCRSRRRAARLRHPGRHPAAALLADHGPCRIEPARGLAAGRGRPSGAGCRRRDQRADERRLSGTRTAVPVHRRGGVGRAARGGPLACARLDRCCRVLCAARSSCCASSSPRR